MYLTFCGYIFDTSQTNAFQNYISNCSFFTQRLHLKCSWWEYVFDDNVDLISKILLQAAFRKSFYTEVFAIMYLPMMFLPRTVFGKIRMESLQRNSYVLCLHANYDILQGSFRLWDSLSMRRLGPWINHFHPVCWNILGKSILLIGWVVSSIEGRIFFFVMYNMYW